MGSVRFLTSPSSPMFKGSLHSCSNAHPSAKADSGTNVPKYRYWTEGYMDNGRRPSGTFARVFPSLRSTPCIFILKKEIGSSPEIMWQETAQKKAQRWQKNKPTRLKKNQNWPVNLLRWSQSSFKLVNWLISDGMQPVHTQDNGIQNCMIGIGNRLVFGGGVRISIYQNSAQKNLRCHMLLDLETVRRVYTEQAKLPK